MDCPRPWPGPLTPSLPVPSRPRPTPTPTPHCRLLLCAHCWAGQQGSQRGVLPGRSLGEPAVCRGLTRMHGTGRQGVSMPRAGCVCLLTPVSSGPRAGIGTWQVSCLSDGWRGGRETGRNRGFEWSDPLMVCVCQWWRWGWNQSCDPKTRMSPLHPWGQEQV